MFSQPSLQNNFIFTTFMKHVRQSVVMWWNMDQAGGYDILTRHAGCPVMIGNKWIVNKWMRSNSQMFKRPCPAYSKEKSSKFKVQAQHFQQGDFFQDP